MPTKFTKTAGLAGIVAAALWVVAIAVYGLWNDYFFDWNSNAYMVFSLFVMAAGAVTFVTSLGLRARHGTLGRLGLAGLIIYGVGVVFSFQTWALPLWMAIQGVGMLFIALAAWPMRVAPRAPLAAYGSGMLIGSITFFILNAMKVGSVDRYGDYPTAWLIGGVVGLLITAAGLAGIGLWLRREQPAAVDAPQDPAITA